MRGRSKERIRRWRRQRVRSIGEDGRSKQRRRGKGGRGKGKGKKQVWA